MKCICPKCNHSFIQSSNTKDRIRDIIKIEGKLNISQICKKLNLSRPSIYYHLSLMPDLIIIKDSKSKGKPSFVQNKDNSHTSKKENIT